MRLVGNGWTRVTSSAVRACESAACCPLGRPRVFDHKPRECTHGMHLLFASTLFNRRETSSPLALYGAVARGGGAPRPEPAAAPPAPMPAPRADVSRVSHSVCLRAPFGLRSSGETGPGGARGAAMRHLQAKLQGATPRGAQPHKAAPTLVTHVPIEARPQNALSPLSCMHMPSVATLHGHPRLTHLLTLKV